MSQTIAAALTGSWAMAGLLVMIGACLQGIGGIGFGMFAAPIIAAIDPELVPGPMLFLGLIIAVFAVVREPRHVDRRGLGWALAGRLPSSVAAVMLMSLLPVRLLGIVFALTILLGVALSLTRLDLRPTPVSLFVAGLVSGFMGTLTSVGLPPIALVYQAAKGATLRATVGGYLVFGTMISLGALAAAGRFGRHDVMLGTGLVVPLMIGFWLSGPLTRCLPQSAVRVLVLALSTLSALLLLARHLIG